MGEGHGKGENPGAVCGGISIGMCLCCIVLPLFMTGIILLAVG